MFEIIRQFFDKKSPIFIITISILISTIILLSYDIDPRFTSAGKLQMFQKGVLIAACVEVFFKTIGMEILKRTCPTNIGKIHIILILAFVVLNIVLYVWSIFLSLDFRTEGVTALNEPHEFFIQIYFLVFSAVYLVILGLLMSIKLENKTMTVLQDRRREQEDRLEA